MMITRRQFVTAISFAAAAPLLARAAQAAGVEPILESRAIFDEGLNWASKESAEIVCERIARAGFNVFMPCVWHGRGAIWPSQLAPWDSAAANIPGFDPLAHLCKVASRYGIEIHPWFTVMRRDREFLPQFYDAGTPGECFDVHREEFRDFIVSLILEVVKNYPVNGINLDYIRAGGVCVSSRCATEYERQTGRNLLLDRAKLLLPGGTVPSLAAWQERAVGDIVRRVSEGARPLNSRIVISVDAVPGHPIDVTQGRNSIKWVDEGLVDVIYMMHYESNPDWASFRALQAAMTRPEALVVLCGNYEEPVSPGKEVPFRDARKVSGLLSEARRFQQGNGVGLYLYSRLSDEQIRELGSQAFSLKARPSWKRAVGPAQPRDVTVS